jgi:membrane protein
VKRVISKFFADRGTHLAAMIAYFALLSFVPLLLLSLALLGLAHDNGRNSFFVRELHRTFPSTSLNSILSAVDAIQDNATALGIVGGSFLLWSSLSLFSVLESAFNIVYGRPNRPFLRGKALATLMMVFSLTFLFVALVVGSIGVDLLRRYSGLSDNVVLSWVLTVSVSLIGVFLFLASAYVVLTNARIRWRQVVPGAAVAAVLLEATFQFLPAFVRISKHNPVLQTLSGPAVLLVWLYVMSNVIVLGAEVNYWLGTHPNAQLLRPARLPPAHDASSDASTHPRSRRPSASPPPG